MTTQAAFGWMGPGPTVDIRVMNRTGGSVAVGDVVVLDNQRLETESTSNSVGLSTGGVGTVSKSLIGSQTQVYGIWGVVLQAAGDDTATTVRLRGQCDAVNCSAQVIISGATISIVTPPTTATLSALVLAGNSALVGNVQTATNCVPVKIIFIPLTARANAGVTDGWFDGISGFGSILKVPT